MLSKTLKYSFAAIYWETMNLQQMVINCIRCKIMTAKNTHISK